MYIQNWEKYIYFSLQKSLFQFRSSLSCFKLPTYFFPPHRLSPFYFNFNSYSKVNYVLVFELISNDNALKILVGKVTVPTCAHQEVILGYF